MKPVVICHMLGSVDGRLHPSRYTKSPDGQRRGWSEVYESAHEALAGDAWMVGRVTMAEMSKAGPHPPAIIADVARPVHRARTAKSYAVALDPSGKLHFAGDTVGGDHVVVLLAHDVEDAHLAELAGDGVSYIVAATADQPLGPMLETLSKRFGVRRLLLEGGAGANGRLLAEGLVDELSVIIAPALDAGADVQGVVAYDEGLSGLVELSLMTAETLKYGVVHLRYRVTPGEQAEARPAAPFRSRAG